MSKKRNKEFNKEISGIQLTAGYPAGGSHDSAQPARDCTLRLRSGYNLAWKLPKLYLRSVLAMGIALAGLGIFGAWPIVNASPVVPELVLKKARNINISESSIQGTAAYLRPMRCAGVNKVAIRLVAIRAGNTDTLWDGTHQRPEGAIAPSASCLLTVLLESGITSKEPNPTVSFQFGKTEGIRSGKKQSVRLPDLATPESWATKEAASKPILADKPVVLYARAAGSKEETERVYNDFFKTSSVEEVVGVSKKHDKLTFLVVIFTWSAG